MIDGAGIGSAIAANKIRGVRAGHLAKEIAEKVEGAAYVELPGCGHCPDHGGADIERGHIEELCGRYRIRILSRKRGNGGTGIEPPNPSCGNERSAFAGRA